MGNYATTKAEVYNYICARTPLLIIESSERERVERMLREIAVEQSIDMYYYSDATQVCSLRNDGVSLDVDQDPLPYLADSFQKQRSRTYALGDVNRIGHDNAYSRELLNILYLAKANNGTLILITADSVWQRLAQFGMLVALDYPDVDERIDLIDHFIRQYRSKYSVDWEYEDVRWAAALLRGFTEIQIDNILSTEIIARKGLYRKYIAELMKQKSRLYTLPSSMEAVQVKPTLQVSGLHALREWLDMKKPIFFATDEDLAERDLQTPKGILLAGIPGCGKSYSAKMVAKEWELPLFRFDIGTIYDKWVGESEKRMKEALQFIDQVAPCVLWIDEIEKALSVSDAGNDTGKRILGQFLFWLQESSSRVFLIATANDISLLPAELFRKGRFSELFFIDLPNEEEREAAIRQYAEKSLLTKLSASAVNELAALSEGFSFADIEYAIKDVAELAIIHGQAAVRQDKLVHTFKSVVPIAHSNPELIEKLRNWGRERASVASKTVGGIKV